MKRAISLALAVILLLSLLLTIVPAAYACGGHYGRNAAPKACTFVDADKDGVCDSCGKSCQKTFVDENKDGICDHCGKACKTHMVDENEDGICDNCGRTCTRHQETACAQPKHLGQGHHGNGGHHG